MNITILGARGLVGSRLAQTLVGQKIDVWCPTRDDEPLLFRRPLGTVYYCIGLTADYRARPFDTVEAHVSLLSRILERADFERLIYLSSTRLYDTLGAVHCAEDAILHISTAEPRHLYDFSKGLGENLCLTASHGRAKVARLSCVLGEQLDDGFIPWLIKQSHGREKLEVDSSPHFYRDYIGLDDVISLLIRIVNEGQSSIYNVASGINTTNQELFDLVSELTGCVIEARSQARAILPSIDISLIRNEFSFSPTPLQVLLKKLSIAGATACN